MRSIPSSGNIDGHTSCLARRCAPGRVAYMNRMEPCMNRRSISTVLAACAALALMLSAAEARSLKWARTGDALTLDPHAQNEGPTHNLAHQIYEPLLIRDAAGNIHPALATSWHITAAS